MVLGVAQNGNAQISAVQPKLVGSAGDGTKLQFAKAFLLFQQPIFRHRGFTLRGNVAQQTGQGMAGNGGIYLSLRQRWCAKDPGVVGFADIRCLQQMMGMGMLSQQDDSKGVPIQTGHGMKGGTLTGFSVVPLYQIGKGAGIAGT